MGTDTHFKMDRRVLLFTLLASSSAALLILCNLVGGKLFEVEVRNVPFLISAGLLPMPLGFVLSSLIQELFGNRAGRWVTFIAVGLGVFMVLLVASVSALPFAPVTQRSTWNGVDASAFERVFLSSQRITIASLTAFATAQLCHLSLLSLLRKALGGRAFGLRAFIATEGSQLVDTFMVEVLAWYGLLSSQQILQMITASLALKLTLSLAVGPLASLSRGAIQAWLQRERPMVLAMGAVPQRG
jgi:uncharacterized integral membrane protein (TIGR00697 family)